VFRDIIVKHFFRTAPKGADINIVPKIDHYLARCCVLERKRIGVKYIGRFHILSLSHTQQNAASDARSERT
jgi:hypothetical protein